MLGPIIGASIVGGIIVITGFFVLITRFYRTVEPGTALVKRGMGGDKVSFNKMVVVPIFQRADIMDISVKRIEIYRHGPEGLICKDNVRADIKVAFFVRVNNNSADVAQVADSVTVARASDIDKLTELFDAKFSEALKTVGKNFNFTELYTERNQFKDAIVDHIGTDLNGYVLDDAAIDYLEQTDLEALDPDNILDAEGIKKITDLTAKEAIVANEITREKEKTIKKQDVEAREAILELEKQQAEAEQKQFREIAVVTARETAEAEKVQEEERYKSEKARISTEEELGIAEENMQRQVLVAQRAKERTDGVELERVQRERDLEATERERVVDLAQIDKDKALEVEKKKIQDVIRERVIVERAVEEEEQKIKDTEEIMTAERAKTVQVTAASAQAEEDKIKEVKKAEAAQVASEFQAKEILIEADANRQAAEKEALGKIKLAEAVKAETAAGGLAEAEVMHAKASAVKEYGTSEADVIQKKGEAEADALAKRFTADADGTAAKAEAMKKLDGVGKEHEEFKLTLDKELQVDLKQIDIQKDIAAEQAAVLGEALKSANIDIVGGDGQFFDQLVNAITKGKQVERFIDNSETVGRLSEALLDGTDGDSPFGERLQAFVGQVGMTTDDIKNLSIAQAINQMTAATDDKGVMSQLTSLLSQARSLGMDKKKVSSLL